LALVDFVGLGEPDNNNNLSILKAPVRSRKIVAIGASDTAGWCVDGNPSTSPIDFGTAGWLYEDCGLTYVAQLGEKFDADISVQAISGIGLTQNAFAQIPWVLGNLTMPDYFNRTIQGTSKHQWNFGKESHVDLVLVSLGGNDYNHQNGDIPSNVDFSSKYVSFLSSLIEVFDDNDDDPMNYLRSATKILCICGMGDPHEVQRDPDNDRCSPCPHVEASVEIFRKMYPKLAHRVHYKLVPCDGSVVKGTDDIGCNGHKNKLGQERVSNFLAPTLSSITGWNQ